MLVIWLCLTLCNTVDCSLPGSFLHGIFQVRILECHSLLQGIFPRQESNRVSWIAATAKSRQSCPTLCDPIDGSQPGSRPWDSPGKDTGVGCHFLLQCMKVKSESEVTQPCPTQRPHGLQPTRLLRPWDFPGKSTGVGCHCLLHNWL